MKVKILVKMIVLNIDISLLPFALDSIDNSSIFPIVDLNEKKAIV
jgi:hypothetical protein